MKWNKLAPRQRCRGAIYFISRRSCSITLDEPVKHDHAETTQVVGHTYSYVQNSLHDTHYSEPTLPIRISSNWSNDWTPTRRKGPEDHSFYAQFNKIDRIKYAVVAYENL